MKALILVCCALLSTGSAWSQDADMEHRPFVIGAINYFGYGDLPLQKVRSAVPWHVGKTVTSQLSPRSRSRRLSHQRSVNLPQM